MLNSWWQDLRYAARLVYGSPGFSTVIIVCLALGIGPGTTVFSLINAALLRPADVEAPNELVNVLSRRGEEARLSSAVSYPVYVDLRDKATTVSGVAAAGQYGVSVRRGETSDLVGCAIVSPNYFDVLGRGAEYGDVFHASEFDPPGSQPVAVLGHNYWVEQFGADPNVVGSGMRINGHDFTIAGVMPASFTGHTIVTQPPFWVSTTMMDQIRPDQPSQLTQRGHSWLNVIARLTPGVTVEQSQEEFTNLSRELAALHPQEQQLWSFTTLPFSGVPREAVESLQQLIALAGVVVLVLMLLSCTSTGAMQLSRATARRREIAIRMSVGATRWRIVRQLLIESVFIAVLAGGLALLLTLWAFASFKYMFPEDLRAYIALGSALDVRLLAFTFGASAIAGILFGLAPAWQLSKPDLLAPLRSQDASADVGSTRIRNVLVAAQFAMAVVLLICAGLFVRGLRHAETLDPGFETERMAVFQTDLSLYGYSNYDAVKFTETLRERLAGVPGVVSVSASRFPPLSSASSVTIASPVNPDFSSGPQIRVGTNVVGPGYFATTGIPLVAGREFNEDDRRGSQAVTIVNETLAQSLGGAEAAVGRLISNGMGEAATIVGVAKDSKYWGLGDEDTAFGYVCLAQSPTRELTFCIRTEGDPAPMKESITAAIRALNGDLALSTLQTVKEQAHESLQTARTSAALFTILGVLALVLATIGIYGVVSYSVARRQLEIGIRMALGGQPGDLVALLVRHGLLLAAIGAAAGTAIALGVTSFLTPLLNGASPRDVTVFVGVPVLLLAVAWLGIYLPARKATRVDPMVVLRYE